jgi:hypothetical protein
MEANSPQTITLRELAGTLYGIAEGIESKAERLRALGLGELSGVESERASVLFSAATELLLMENWQDG